MKYFKQIESYSLWFSAALLIALSALSSAPANAEIYKHVDANGNISYSDQAPSAQANVVELSAGDSKANIIESTAESREANAAFFERRMQKRDEEAARASEMADWRKQLKAAKLELKLARKAKANGVVVAEGDFVGRAGGGARPSASYYRKLEELDARVNSAEQKLATVKHAKPR